jgi:hypothetical protein
MLQRLLTFSGFLLTYLIQMSERKGTSTPKLQFYVFDGIRDNITATILNVLLLDCSNGSGGNHE